MFVPANDRQHHDARLSFKRERLAA